MLPVHRTGSWGLRDYGVDGQLGLEKTPEEYVEKMVAVFREVKRVLRDDGTLWLNLGDSYATSGSGAGQSNSEKSEGAICDGFRDAKYLNQRNPKTAVSGLKPKDLCGIPWRVALALQKDGWYLRQDIIWHKPNPMPESVRDRCTKAHEYIFLLSKKPQYFYDAEATKEPMADSSVVRLSQNIDSQMGSDRVPGKTNGNMKAVGRRSIKPVGIIGESENRGQTPGPLPSGNKRNKRSVWTVNDLTNFVFWILETHPEIDVSKYFDIEKKDVWTVTTKPYSEAHFATFPPDLILPCILAGCPQEVCKKCGEPRRRVVEHTAAAAQRVGGDANWHKNNGDRPGGFYDAQNKTTGWTDCGCKQYFCNNCKKFLTPELVDGIMSVKGDNYAIQGHREKEKVLTGVGKEKVSRTAGAGGVVEADSLLCKKDMSDLWHRILREKDATDLFSEMWGSVADTKRESQRVSKGDTPSKLQGGISKQGRVQSNPDTEEICNGASLLDGATLGAEINQKRGSSSQKRGKERQQAGESCDKTKDNSPRHSVVSVLQQEFQSEIACPFCLSSQISIERADFRPGIVIDPFMGSGTTAVVAYQNNRHYVGVELNPDYCKLKRIQEERDKYALFNTDN